MTEYFNRSNEKGLRRRLRKEMPKAEVLLWSRLRSKQLLGKRFRRQYSVGPFSIDFYCPEVNLAVELDGDTHLSPEARRHDAERQAYVESFGIRFVRFSNNDVCENLDGVIQSITAWLRDSPDKGTQLTVTPS
jgi:very-short-patch-repair endonuclease